MKKSEASYTSAGHVKWFSAFGKCSGRYFVLIFLLPVMYRRGKFWGRTRGLGRQILAGSEREKLLSRAGMRMGSLLRPEFQGRVILRRCLRVGGESILRAVIGCFLVCTSLPP